jgi:hypothetical protein
MHFLSILWKFLYAFSVHLVEVLYAFSFNPVDVLYAFSIYPVEVLYSFSVYSVEVLCPAHLILFQFVVLIISHAEHESVSY